MLAKQILIISILFPFIEYYSYIAVNRVSRKARKPYRYSILAFYIVLSIAVIGSLFVFRKWATTEWPSVWAKVLVNFLLGVFLGKFLMALIMLAGDILLVLKSLIRLLFSIPDRIKGKPHSGHPITRSQFISSVSVAAGALLTGTLSYGITNRYRYKLRYVPVPLSNIPDELRKLRIVQISDIHCGSFDNPDEVSKGVDMAMNARPDLILFTGDMVNYRAEEVEPYLNIFKKLQAPLGVFSILGNHDYSDYLSWPSESEKKKDFDRLKNHHKSLGWQLLLNEHVILRHNTVDFALIGSENWSSRHRFAKYGNLPKAMAGLPDSGIPLKLLMSHDPSHWDAEIRPMYPDVNITFSGHTHGMQMGIEIPGMKWSPVQYFYKQWAGLYRENDQYLYVNRGFGFIGYNGRVGIMPEITLLELV
jgi:predicted MPP superfamily phosphohydrolase